MSLTYQTNYSKYIEKLYGTKRDIQNDINLVNSNNLTIPHNYVINNRTDLTAIETYSIDPDGCQDADDAFSVFFNDDKLYLAIHIADPTEYININSSLWQDVEKRIITKYPSNTKPIHMLPDEIMEKSSLMDNAYGNIKKAITVLTEINKETFLPENNIKLLFTKIKVKKENTLSYQKASENIIEPIQYGLNISSALQEKRSEKTLGTKLKSVSTSTIKYDDSRIYLHRDTINEKRMKQMIEEFAIFANSFIGEYFKIHFDGFGIFRTCDASLLEDDEFKNLTGDELLHYIITNGIRADYMNTVSSHDLVGSKEYTHFTSPIRRASDCVCHYLLKFIYLKNINSDIDIPFSKEKLEMLSEKCLVKTKQMKKIQYTDTKFRLIQVMDSILKEKNELEIQYCITGYLSGFINIIIKQIDDYPVYLSYSLKRNIDSIDSIDNKEMFNLKITVINCRKRFDEGSIPELDCVFPY
jgi:exoribonuclease R